MAAQVRPARQAEQVPSCPSCRREMGRCDAVGNELGVEVEHCPSCDLWWFDPHEVEQATDQQRREGRARSTSATAAEWQRRQLQRTAVRAQDRLERKQSRAPSVREREFELRLPSSGLKLLLTLIGMPAEEDAPEVRTKPWITWSLALLAGFLSLSALTFAPLCFDWLALWPSTGGGALGLQYLSYFFLHGSIYHLLTNLYFLIVFGDNVEELLGSARYLLLLTVATAISGLAHVLIEPQSEIPLVGASGGISAIVVYYGLALPRVRLSIFVLLFWIRIPALWALLAWLAVQVTGIFDQLDGRSDISFAGHLAGAAVGFLAWLLMRPTSASGAEVGLKRPRY